jgi:hypothetical protein
MKLFLYFSIKKGKKNPAKRRGRKTLFSVGGVVKPSKPFRLLSDCALACKDAVRKGHP